MSGVNFGYRLTVRHPKEHFTLRYAPQKPAEFITQVKPNIQRDLVVPASARV